MFAHIHNHLNVERVDLKAKTEAVKDVISYDNLVIDKAKQFGTCSFHHFQLKFSKQETLCNIVCPLISIVGKGKGATRLDTDENIFFVTFIHGLGEFCLSFTGISLRRFFF